MGWCKGEYLRKQAYGDNIEGLKYIEVLNLILQICEISRRSVGEEQGGVMYSGRARRGFT